MMYNLLGKTLTVWLLVFVFHQHFELRLGKGWGKYAVRDPKVKSVYCIMVATCKSLHWKKKKSLYINLWPNIHIYKQLYFIHCPVIPAEQQEY